MHIPRIIFTRPHRSRRRSRSLGPRDVCGDGRGNVKGGQVTGETDKIATKPAWIGYSPDDLEAFFPKVKHSRGAIHEEVYVKIGSETIAG